MNIPDFDNILAIDTATDILRLAIRFGGDRLVKSTEAVEKSHGQILFKKIRELMESAAIKPADLDGIAVGIGPGSFTGLRIGLAAVKGLVMAHDIPVIGITAFEVAAYRLREVGVGVTVVVPLNRDECIIGPVDNGRHESGRMAVARYDTLFETVGAGAVAALGFDLAARFPGLPNDDFSDRLEYDGADLIHLGAIRLEAGEAADIGSLEPLYLQKSQAEIRFDRRQEDN